MKKLIITLAILCMAFAAPAQVKYEQNGNTFKTVQSEKSSKSEEPTKTPFFYEDSKGTKYPIYISSSGSCFVIKVSKKTGKQYRQYLGKEISQQICKQLGITYKGK